MTYEAHPAAAVFPMLPDDELQALADDIAANGLLHPIVKWIDPEHPTPWKGEVVLDGRNRLAACQLAGVTPTFVEYEGDPVAFVLGANVARRHMTTGARAMATAVVLAADGRRSEGRWARGSVPANGEFPNSTWRAAMADAGVVLDVTPEIAPAVIAGAVSLHAAHVDALAARDRAQSFDARLAKLPADLAVRVREDGWPIDEAEAAARQRDKRVVEERRDARALLVRSLDLISPEDPSVDFVESWARHLGEIDDSLLMRLDAAIDVLTDLRKRVDQ